MGMADAAEKGFDCREVDSDDVRRDLSVSLSVDLLGGSSVGSVHQAKPGPTVLIEPVGHILDAVLVLNLKIPAMRVGDRVGDRVGSHVAHIVSVHEYRHGGP